jgi:hypothetical protein
MVQKFLALDKATRDTIWGLPPEVLRSLLQRLSEAELQEFAAALLAPHITPTPVAVVVQGLLSGTVTIAKLQATPTPGATPRAGAAVAQAGAATATPTPTTTPPGNSADAVEVAAAPAAGPAAVVPGQNDPLVIAGLGVLVALLAAVAGLLWLRPARKRQ